MFSEDFTKESESHEIFTKESLQVSYGWGLDCPLSKGNHVATQKI